MIVILANMKVKEGKADEFEALVRDLAASVRSDEPGNHMYTLNKTKEGSYVFIERYDDKEALKAHSASPHFKASFATMGGLLDGMPEIQQLTEIV